MPMLLTHMIDILDLPGLVTTSRRIDPDMRLFRLKAKLTGKRPRPSERLCSECGGGKLHGHGDREITLIDTPVHLYKVQISLNVPRFRCQNEKCMAVTQEELPWMDFVHLMTRRCVRWIREQCVQDTFAHIAEYIGCDEGTVQSIAYDEIFRRNLRYVPTMPAHLGIDEIALHGCCRCVLTDVTRRRVIDILPDREKDTVKKWLEEHQSPNLRVITIDMWKHYRDAIGLAFPGRDVPIVIDKFHVVRMANQAVDGVRIMLSSKMSQKRRQWWTNNRGLLRARHYRLPGEGKALKLLVTWLKNYPDLAIAYELKEKFFAIYGLQTRREADDALEKWREAVEAQSNEIRLHFNELVRATANWRKEILAYFDHKPRVTNAFTESMNSVIRVADRRGRGYDFEVLRARVLFGRPLKYPRDFPEEFEKLAKMRGAPKWLKAYAKKRIRKDVEGLEESFAMQDIFETKDALIAKFGNKCTDCGGKLESKLRDLRRVIPPSLRRYVNIGGFFFCDACQKPFTVACQKDEFQPRPWAHKRRVRSVPWERTRAMDLAQLRDPSADQELFPRKGKRRRPKKTKAKADANGAAVSSEQSTKAKAEVGSGAVPSEPSVLSSEPKIRKRRRPKNPLLPF